MKYTGIRHGEYAVIDSVEYKCGYNPADRTVVLSSQAPENPNPELYEWNEKYQRWLAEIPYSRCDRVYSVNAYARYFGKRVSVTSADSNGMAQAYYEGQNSSWAEEIGFVQVERYVHLKDVHVTELHDVHEEQKNLLFTTWREENFTQPPGMRRGQTGGWHFPRKVRGRTK
jgi:hypothetical protein